VDPRPSDLDPYPAAARDLGSPELWGRSLARSRHRRRLRELDRKHAPKRKGAALMGAGALLAGPAVSPLSALASSGGMSAAAQQADDGTGAADTPSLSATQLLEYGDTGAAVAAVQQKLRIAADGIFGPKTRFAVRAFQRAERLEVTGVVDAEMWAKLFGAGVPFSSSGAGQQRVAVQVGAGAGSEESGSSSDETPSETSPTTTATADGCTTGRIATPVSGTETSPFGESRGNHRHTGVDLAAPTGTPVKAAQCGTVSFSGVESGYGNLVCVQHAGAITTCYAHLSRIAASSKQTVQAGQVVGYVGCTGNCTGPHLHFEVRREGTPVDPEPYLRGAQTIGATSAQSTTSTAARTAHVKRANVSTGGSGGAVAPSA
jgi:murein DD-endopeptidase MepM/ murein hydrolase activator NlpD